MIKVILICPVLTKSGMDNLQKTLENILPDVREKTGLLVGVQSPELYPGCREMVDKVVDNLPDTTREMIEPLVQFFDEKADIIEASKSLIKKCEWVFLLDESITMKEGDLTSLLATTTEKPRAGLITGLSSGPRAPYWVDNIYSNNPKMINWGEREVSGKLIEIDMCPPLGMLVNRTAFDNSNGYGSVMFGIRLRRLGYRNYLNTEIKYKNGEKDGKDNNAEGSPGLG